MKLKRFDDFNESFLGNRADKEWIKKDKVHFNELIHKASKIYYKHFTDENVTELTEENVAEKLKRVLKNMSEQDPEYFDIEDLYLEILSYVHGNNLLSMDNNNPAFDYDIKESMSDSPSEEHIDIEGEYSKLKKGDAYGIIDLGKVGQVSDINIANIQKIHPDALVFYNNDKSTFEIEKQKRRNTSKDKKEMKNYLSFINENYNSDKEIIIKCNKIDKKKFKGVPN